MPQTALTDRSPHSPPYKRHRPEQTLLYQIIEQHDPEFRDVMAMQGKSLPLHVQQEFTDYLKRTIGAWIPAGAELSISTALPVRQPPAADGACAGDCLQGHIVPSHQEVGIHSKKRTDRCDDADPAIRQRAEPQRSLSHAVSGWCLHHHVLG